MCLIYLLLLKRYEKFATTFVFNKVVRWYEAYEVENISSNPFIAPWAQRS